MISHAKPSKPTNVPLIKKKQAAGSKRSEVGIKATAHRKNVD